MTEEEVLEIESVEKLTKRVKSLQRRKIIDMVLSGLFSTACLASLIMCYHHTLSNPGVELFSVLSTAVAAMAFGIRCDFNNNKCYDTVNEIKKKMGGLSGR